jgi:cobalt-zinc-cadmium efflux system membrane fusion protein
MSATGSLPVGEPGTRLLSVPLASLQRLDDGWVVFVPRATGVFAVRRVGRGRDLGGEVELVSGVRAGESVVVEGAFLLKAEAEKARGEGEHHDH